MKKQSCLTLCLVGIGAVSLFLSGCGGGSTPVTPGNPGGAPANVQFAAPTTDSVGASPAAIVVADFNGDGKPDIAVANSVSNDVSILLGNGDGTFQPAVNFPAANSPQSIAIGDFNGDGRLDLALFQPGNFSTNTPASVSVLLGDGDGTFQAPKTTTLTVFDEAIEVADFNLDKKSDLAVNEDNQTLARAAVLILLSNGDGTFQTAKQTVVPSAIGALVAADFNGDGKPDIAVGIFVTGISSSFPEISILLGNGDGTFSQGVTMAVARPAARLLSADLNHDGKADLLAHSSQEVSDEKEHGFRSNLSVFLGNGDGSFRGEQIIASNATATSFVDFANPFVGDFNGDGKPDVAYVSNGSLVIQLGNGDGTFSAAPSTGIPANSTFGAPAAGDFKSDKLSDVAVIEDPTTNTISVFLNTTP